MMRDNQGEQSVGITGIFFATGHSAPLLSHSSFLNNEVHYKSWVWTVDRQLSVCLVGALVFISMILRL